MGLLHRPVIMKSKNCESDRGAQKADYQTAQTFKPDTQNKGPGKSADNRCIYDRRARQDVVCYQDRRGEGKSADGQLSHTLPSKDAQRSAYDHRHADLWQNVFRSASRRASYRR